uniref:PDZ domain-containing protein n=1 Tax=Mesocestoides corti TaxID=53468 RepID=A0A5K3F4F5_MESCO
MLLPPPDSPSTPTSFRPPSPPPLASSPSNVESTVLGVLSLPRLRLFTVLLTRPPLQGIGGASTSAPSFRALVVDAHVPGVFGLILRAATDGELSCAPGNLVVDSIVPDSPAARSGMLQIGDRLLGIDREPVGWLTVADVERFARPYDSLTFEFGRLPPLHSRTSTYSSPSDHLVFDAYDFGLGTLREGEVVRASSPISVNPVRYHPEPAAGANQRAAGDPIRPSGRNDSTSVTATTYNYEVDEEEEEDKEVEDMGNGVNIRQIQLPFVPQSSSNDVRPHPRLGLSISAGKGSSSGQWVVGVTPNSPAAQSGLRVGDCILGLDDRLLIACGGHDSAKVLQAIETAWASRLPTTDAQQVTLTVLRQAPVSLPTAAEKKSPFPQFDVPTRRSDALLPPQYFRANRRYPKDVGDNLDVHLQAAPPGLLTPLMVGVTAGAVGGALYRGAVDDPVGQTYFHPPGESGDHVAVATNGFSLDAGDSHATNYDDIVEREALFEDHDADGDLFHKGDGDYDNGNENFDQGNSMESPEPLDYRGDGAEDTY